MSMSAVRVSPLIGSLFPYSFKYFSISRLSNTLPDEGEITGVSGTSFETKNVNRTNKEKHKH